MPQQSLADSDCIIIMGSNMAENHPVGFRFVMKAKERGGQVIHIDPRFARTSAMADMHVPLRAGSDLAFLGGLINYVLASDRWNNEPFFREFVRHYTNGPAILGEDYQDAEDLAGRFSGFDPETGAYDPSTWRLSGEQDPEMQDPRCAFQIIKRHFSRYTPEMVEKISGVPKEHFLQVAETLLENSGPDRTSSFCYAVAWTQHTTGTQIISCCALLQLLLGNMGRPGGGILALRGHATIQGSTDIPTLYNLLPGYLPMPAIDSGHYDLQSYIDANRLETGWWHNFPKYIVSLLKAWYGENAAAENDFLFDFIPKIAGDYSFASMMPMMKDGTIKGLFCMGMNPAVGGQNSRLIREGLANLDWMVMRDPYEIESAAFWYDSPEVRNGDVRPQDIKTEIFFLPPAVTPEKDGSYTNTQRLVQWHEKAVDPPGDSRSEPWFLYHLGRRLKALYEGEDTPQARQLQSVIWDYETEGIYDDPRLEQVVEEINGYTVADRALVSDFTELKDDGSTACGCWIYSGIMPEPGVNLSRRRKGDDRASLDWGFAWPANRRILYNRASADPSGKPWSEHKRWVWWDEDSGTWTGYDVPDFPANKAPYFEPEPGSTGMDAHRGDAPFIMMPEGRGLLFVPTGLIDGPIPTHYEPWETPVTNLLYPEQARSPVVPTFDRPDNEYHEVGDPRFPYVLTTYRLTEHHTAGGMSRYIPWLAELQPGGFAEISPELAGEFGIDNGDWVTITTARGSIETRALVTERLQPLRIHDREVHQIGMPWHYGWGGLATGDIANDLSALIEDPNSRIHQAKAFTCDLNPGRIERRNGADRHGE